MIGSEEISTCLARSKQSNVSRYDWNVSICDVEKSASVSKTD